MLQAQDFGAPWFALIRAWVDFEVRHEFKEVVKLGAKHRPACVGEWMQCRRSTTWRPPLTGSLAYEAKFMKWWTGLQPKWRLLDDGEIDFSAVEGDLDELRRPGLRGLVSVLVGLFYWALELKSENKGHEQWLIAVADCRLVCGHLLASAA